MNEIEHKKMLMRKLSPNEEHYIKDMLYMKNMLQRDVEYACLSNRGNCADCGKTSQYMVVEKYVEDRCGECNKDKNTQRNVHKAWYWCGVCRVG